MSWEYLSDDNPETDQIARLRAPGYLGDTAAADIDTGSFYPVDDTQNDPLAAYDETVRAAVGEYYTSLERQDAVRRLYQRPGYSVLSPANLTRLATSLDDYRQYLERPDAASALLHAPSEQNRPEAAAAALAALSMTGQTPYSSLSGQIARWLDIGSRRVHDNLALVRGYLLKNRALLPYFDGLIGVDRDLLEKHGVVGLSRRDVGKPVLTGIPQTLAILMADIVHDTSHPLLPTFKAASGRSINSAQDTIAKHERLARYTNLPLESLHLQPPDRKDLRKAQELLEAEERRRAVQSDRRQIEKTIAAAATRWLGFRPDDRRIHVMAECLVASSHNLDETPGYVVEELANRMRTAAERDGVRLANQLPQRAAGIYNELARYKQRRA